MDDLVYFWLRLLVVAWLCCCVCVVVFACGGVLRFVAVCVLISACGFAFSGCGGRLVLSLALVVMGVRFLLVVVCWLSCDVLVYLVCLRRCLRYVVGAF